MPIKLSHGIYLYVRNMPDNAFLFANNETRQSLRSPAPNSCSCSIMDETTVDNWIVLDTETYLPLGRPIVTINIDVATRMVVGYLVSFEPPSQCIEPVSRKVFRHGSPEVARRDAWTTNDERGSGLTDERRTAPRNEAHFTPARLLSKDRS